MIAGWHIEELVYSSFYGEDPESPYYSKYHINAQRGYETQVIEARLPDVVMIHLTASDAAIAERMETTHTNTRLSKKPIFPTLKRLFQEEIDRSLFYTKGTQNCVGYNRIRHRPNRLMSCSALRTADYIRRTRCTCDGRASRRLSGPL